MGETYLFSCNYCEFTAQVSGGSDAGLTAITVTIACSICQNLQDVVIRNYDLRKQENIDFKPACRKDPSHPVKRWKERDPCPLCGRSVMKIKRTALWD